MLEKKNEEQSKRNGVFFGSQAALFSPPELLPLANSFRAPSF